MKIRGWSIDGFGVFQDWAVSGLPDGLTVVQGANEAGKSTLLEFLRLMLFGPSGHSERADVSPFGRPRRGSVALATDDGEVVVERALDQPDPPLLRRLDGRPVDANALTHLLAGADGRLFREVFTISLEDLQSLATLDGAGVRAYLFSATLVGAARSARAAARTLSAEAAARLDGEGAAQASRLIAELEALRPRLNAARHAALAYSEQRAEAERLAAAVEGQRAALAERRTTHLRDGALLRAWPVWESLLAARAELVRLELVDEPPDEAQAQLAAARERLHTAENAVRALRAEQAALERQAEIMPAGNLPTAVRAEVEALHVDLSLYRLHVSQLTALRERCAETEQMLAERLQGAGPDWTAERLRTWSRVGVDRDRIRDWQGRLRAATEREQHAQTRLEAASAAREAARRDCETLRAELDARVLIGGAEIERRRGVLAALRAALEETAILQSRGESTAQIVREHEDAVQRLDGPGEAPLPAWPIPLMHAVAVASVAVGIWSLVYGTRPATLAAVAVAAASLAAAHWMGELRRTQGERIRERQAAQRRSRSELEAARRTRDGAWRRAAQVAAEIATQAASLRLPHSPTGADLTAAERALDEATAGDARGAAGRGRLVELQRVLAGHDEAQRTCANTAAGAAAARHLLEQEWAAWCTRVGFAAETTSDAVLDRVGTLEAAHAALVVHETVRRELQQIESMVATWDGRARAVLARHGTADADTLTGEGLMERLLALRLSLQDEAPLWARRTVLDADRRDRAARLAAAEAEVARCRSEVDRVLRAAGAVDEVDLARRCELAERRRALRRTTAEQERAIAECLGSDATMAELETGAADAWQQRAAAAGEELAALEQRVHELGGESHQARAACRAEEESPDVAALELEWAAVSTELGQVVRDWRVLAAAEGLIDEARVAFERTRQPVVLRAASEAFAAVTRGRYDRIVQDDLAQSLVVVERGGARKQVGSELSRGTTEQLYLSLRLGLAHEFAGRGIVMPLVMDDVLVNFDPERARAMAEVLGTVGRRQQVLFFTCHPATGDLLMRHGGAERVVEL